MQIFVQCIYIITLPQFVNIAFDIMLMSSFPSNLHLSLRQLLGTHIYVFNFTDYPHIFNDNQALPFEISYMFKQKVFIQSV